MFILHQIISCKKKIISKVHFSIIQVKSDDVNFNAGNTESW